MADVKIGFVFMPQTQSLIDVAAIHWTTNSYWQAINHSLAHVISRYPTQLRASVATAQQMNHWFQELFPLMEELCAATCAHCPDPCCLSARAWIDFRDLLFWHLAQIDIPAQQLRARADDTCRYFSPKGCTLPRSSRPWICTWYLCATQTACGRRQFPHKLQYLTTLRAKLKKARGQLEEAFIAVVT